MTLKDRLQADIKDAMRAREKALLATLRLAWAAIRQREVDERTDLDDRQVLLVLRKMIKQRQDSVTQFSAAGREELAEKERQEIAVLQVYLPAELDDDALAQMVQAAIAETGAAGQRDMGKVMALLKERAQGRADMGKVSALVKQALA